MALQMRGKETMREFLLSGPDGRAAQAGVQVERQADDLRQGQQQVQVRPAGAQPGQRGSAHRPQAEAERQEGWRPEPSGRQGPLHRCQTNTQQGHEATCGSRGVGPVSRAQSAISESTQIHALLTAAAKTVLVT